MKIVAYEVREDEAEIMKKLAGKLGIDENWSLLQSH